MAATVERMIGYARSSTLTSAGGDDYMSSHNPGFPLESAGRVSGRGAALLCCMVAIANGEETRLRAERHAEHARPVGRSGGAAAGGSIDTPRQW